MSAKQLLKSLVPNFIIEAARVGPTRMETFAFNKELDVSRDIQDKFGYNGILLDLFAGAQGSAVHKWHHFIPLYERYFAPFRGRKIKFLEIGVSKGGSLQMWRKYFGDDAIIFGIDIDAECVQFNGVAGQVRIGSQADKNFLESVVNEMGGVDIILDDGSHHMKHISASLTYLFPYLSDGGIYMIEDLHTAYWSSWGGGYRTKRNFFRFVMDLVDDIHHWYHSHGLKQPAISNNCSGIHIHDSIVVLEKNKIYRPVHSING